MTSDTELYTKNVDDALAKGQCYSVQDGFGKPVQLGKGSFGRVVLAIHRVTQSYYAVKMMSIDSAKRIKYQQRELDLLIKLQVSHRNIIQYFNSWESVLENKQTFCIQMELCLLSLEDYVVVKNGLYNPSIAIVKDERFYKHIFPQILNGLDAIHSVGWVHRDIHPGNILIANPKPSGIQDIVIKIADFGLARRIAEVVDSSIGFTVKPELEKLSPHVGHWLFRAPELSTPYYNYKVDLYSAGIVLYFLCRYLEDVRQWETEIKQLIADPRSKLSDVYHKDEMLFKLLNCLLKRKPDERLSSAREALDTFRPLFNNTDGLNVATSKCSDRSVEFLIKKEGEDTYNRCWTVDDSFHEIKVAVEKATGIRAEYQVLRQEFISANGEKELMNCKCSIDSKAAFRSADDAHRKVEFIVSEEPSSGMEVDQASSSDHELSEL